MRVLVAEDKRSMADLLRRALEEDGYEVSLAFDGDAALSLGLARDFEVIVLDLMLPRRDGFAVIRELRKAKRRTPVLVLSARDAMSDIIKGLDSGADDYLTKPFVLDVLLARVRAAARRAPEANPAGLQFQDLTLNPLTYEIQRGERVATLTRIEFALLETLMRRARTVVPKEVLIQEGWGGDPEVSGANLYVFIRSLRSKITQRGEPELLHTVRGVGYSLRGEIC